MWSVLRRTQGIEYDESTRGLAAKRPPPRSTVTTAEGTNVTRPSTVTQRLDAFHANQRTIANHECRPDPPAQDPTKLTSPYGDFVYEKLLRHTKHDSVAMRIRALDFLLELYTQKPEHVVSSLKENAVSVLASALSDPEEEVRARACAALQLVAQQPNGQMRILAEDHCGAILAVVEDVSPMVVTEGLRLCCSMHSAFNDCQGTKELIRRKAIPKYVARASSPDDDVCAAALAALTKVFEVKEAFIEVLDCGGLGPMTEAVNSRDDPTITVEALEGIGKLAFYSAGKRAAIHQHTVRPVISLISHPDCTVRTAASGALVALTISEKGKLEAIGEGGVVAALLAAIKEEDERDVLINEVKTLCNISEHPVARLQLFDAIPRLEELKEATQDHHSLLSSIERAIAMIRWQPGDAY